MQNFHKVIIIGAGPIGLYAASKLENANVDYLVIEGSNVAGGQITHLYPEKEIVDIPGIESIKAKDFIKVLNSKVNPNKIILNERVLTFEIGENIEIFTTNAQYFCEKLIIATGLGTAVPRPLGIENENTCKNIIYSVKEFDHFKNKRVAIFGGGDSALDWAKEISAISDDVHLIHRRTEFRGNPDTIRNCHNLKLHLPYVPAYAKIENNVATEIVIKKVNDETLESIPVDYIFVNYGNVAQQTDFPLHKTGAFIDVNSFFLSEKNIYAIGDVAQYENKKRRIAPGIAEANAVIKQIIG